MTDNSETKLALNGKTVLEEVELEGEEVFFSFFFLGGDSKSLQRR